MKNLLLLITLLSLSSCGTLFTSSKQSITFVGQEGIRIYDNGRKIATIGQSGEVVVPIRKKLGSKELLAKKEGYRPSPLRLEPSVQPVSFINLLNVIAWAIDLGTQKAAKWETTYFEVEMEKN